MNNHNRHPVGLVLLLLFPLVVRAQFYPCPQPVDQGRESQLLAALRHSEPDRDKVRILLSLADIYENRPLRNDPDLNRAMVYAREGSELSNRLRDETLYNEALYYVADISTFQGDMKAAEGILGSLNDTFKLKLLLTISYKCWASIQDWPKSLFFAEQAKALSVRLHQPGYEALAYNYIAMVHYYRGDTSAISELMGVLKRYEAIKYRNMHYIYYYLSEANANFGHFDKAEYYSTECIKSMQATGDTLGAADFYWIRSFVTYSNQDYQKSLDYGLLSIAHVKVHPGQFSLADRSTMFSRPVEALRKMKRYGEALRFMADMKREYPPLNAGDEAENDKMTGNIYRDMKAYDKAAACFEAAFHIASRQHLLNYSIYKDLGQLYVDWGRYARAKIFLDKALDLVSKVKPPPSVETVSFLQYLAFIADSATGNYRSAIHHLSGYRLLEEFNQKQAMGKEVKRLQVEYGVKEKENAIALLDQNVKLDAIRLRQSRMERNITVIAVLVVLLLAVIFYLQYRSKKHAGDVIARQNSVINQKNRDLELMLREKEWLLKEVHHRVKNNLQTIISLLESQAAYLQSDALRAIETSQNRIYTMSLIHQKLYRSDDIKTIDMAEYIPELVEYLKDSFGNTRTIDFVVDIAQVSLDASIAIPLALIINEALTNSIKYAFPDGRRGVISIALAEEGEWLKLELGDDGVGLDEHAIRDNTVSLGLQLVKGLTKEIHGDVVFSNDHGLKITVLFKKFALEYADIV